MTFIKITVAASDLGPFARRSRFPKTLRGKAAVNLSNLFIELKRRNVYKVAIAYAVVAWLLMQIATQVFPFLEIPNWAIRMVIMLLALGFPIALFLAWAYELTPEGIRRTDQIEPGQRSRNRAWIYIVIVAGGDFGQFVSIRALHNKFKTKRKRRVADEVDCRSTV
jgi:hypothetical protein